MKKTLSKILIASVFVSIVFLVFTFGYVLNLKSGIADNILRLHIIGASDEALDQSLKLKVRDRILRDYSDIFKECTNMEETLCYADDNLKEIEKSAKDELVKYGCNREVTAELKITSFPTKNYENITLPKGKYTALNIKIGNGDGQNWWCVLYPPLCITDNIISVPDASKEKLKEVLSDEEYKLISDKDNCQIKFKIAEIIGRYIK